MISRMISKSIKDFISLTAQMKDIRGLGNTSDLNKHSDAFVNSSVSEKYS